MHTEAAENRGALSAISAVFSASSAV